MSPALGTPPREPSVSERILMRTALVTFPKAVASLAVAALLAAGLTVAGPQVAAFADSPPADSSTPSTVAADGLPTVQIDGVAWSQVVVGNAVYVAGQFTTARPAGAALGDQTVARSNLLAYNLDTGALIENWAPALDGPAYVITASLDGTRLYVGGDFTTVNGIAQNRFVVLNRSDGARIVGINPNVNGAVRAITSTPSTVYFGGSFTSVTGNTRNRLAAISVSTGALIPWTASAQSAQVESMVMSPDQSRVIVSGRFATLNGISARGSGALSASTGAVLPWAVNTVVANYGYAAGIMGLETDGNLVYGSGFAFIRDANSAGNLEGVFAANPNTGEIVWIDDCHGDTYSVFANPGNDAVYSVGHVHYCGNVGQYPDGAYRYALAFSKKAATTVTPNAVGNYYNWAGFKAPGQLNFYPDLTRGTFTGQGQAAWDVTGNSQYVALGGEFLTVNGQPQQGLVRMAVSAKSTNLQGPRLSGTALTPVATSKATGTAQVSWPTNWDADNETLTYTVLRDGTPVYTTTGSARNWQLSRLSFTDTGLVSGRTYGYAVVSSDSFGNSVTSPAVNVNVTGTSAGALGQYPKAVLDANPAAYWRLGENNGSVQDWTGYADATAGNQVTRGVTGAIVGDVNKAARFSGSSNSRVYSTRSVVGPNRFSLEAWFKTTSTTGGKIIGFGTSSTSTNSSNYDRHVYMGTDGKLRFGVNPNTLRVLTSPAAYNDGLWHHLVASLGSAGMRLYVDGALRAQDPGTLSGQQISGGFWHIGGDSVAGWPGAGSDNFAGDIDDVAVYSRALTSSEVAAHRVAGTGGVDTNSPPSAAFTATGGELSAAVDGSASTDPDGLITSYAWDFGDGAAGTGVTATHAYSAAGTYPVTLTVTDERGASASVAHNVVVVGAASSVQVSDAFERTVTTGFGTADRGGAWSATSGTSVANGAGKLTLASASASASARVTAISGTALTTQVTEDWDKRPVGSGGYFLVRGRITANGEYRLKIGHKSAGAVTARIVQTNAAGTETGITAELTVPGLTYGTGAATSALLEVSGTSPTTLRAKVWAASDLQPAAWLIDTTDATASLQGAGHTGIAASVSSTTTNVPVIVRIDDYVVTGPNQAPIASFTATGGELQASVNAAASTDLDGTITSYAWDFGDGGTGTGVSASHAYAAGGTYQVTLTLTDDDGAIGSITHDVVVAGLNQPPVPDFTVTPTGLTVAVDASATTDPDGTVASYAWDFGDSTAPGTGQTTSHAYTVAGTYTVTLTATDDDGAFASTTRDTTVVVPNQPPTASFTATGGELTASFDGSASSDSDGTLVSYAWDFGDGGTSTEVAPTHPYAVGGTYTVRLTVTDDDGDTGTVTQPVVVTTPNVAPTASFVATTWGLSMTVNGSASSDSDGTISSYAWDFGDGSAPATGATPPSHAYPGPGTYPVTLTVTDNDGATGSSTQSIALDPAATGLLAADPFERAAANGFGTADLGGAWTATANVTAVAGGTASISLAAKSSGAGARLPSVTGTSLTTQVTERWDKQPNGSGGWFLLRGRINAGGEYRLKVGHKSAGAVTAQVVRTNAAGTETAITTEATVTGVTYTAGTPIVVLFEVSGTSTTTLRAKVWAASQAQPAGWLINTSDTTAALQGAGHTGVAAVLSSTTTNVPVTVRIDNYSVTAPVAPAP